MQLNNAPISDAALADAATEVKAAVDAMVADGHDHPTEFEINTAMAFVYYKKAAADIVVLEVGLGGRLDATNVISDAEAAVITSISFDHQEYLGDTLEKIAFEKAGIIKEGCDVCVYALNPPSVKKVIADFAAARTARVHMPEKSDIRLIASSICGQRLRYEKKDSLLGVGQFDLGLLGSHQVYNALNALTALEVLKKKGWKITPDAVMSGMAGVQFSGRFEILNVSPLIVIDGGHNIEGITSFVENFKMYFPVKKRTFFSGCCATSRWMLRSRCFRRSPSASTP
jgi:dihydrofolate synthase/folylpolyglutamate synthase